MPSIYNIILGKKTEHGKYRNIKEKCLQTYDYKNLNTKIHHPPACDTNRPSESKE